MLHHPLFLYLLSLYCTHKLDLTLNHFQFCLPLSFVCALCKMVGYQARNCFPSALYIIIRMLGGRQILGVNLYRLHHLPFLCFGCKVSFKPSPLLPPPTHCCYPSHLFIKAQFLQVIGLDFWTPDVFHILYNSDCVVYVNHRQWLFFFCLFLSVFTSFQFYLFTTVKKHSVY